MKKTLDKIENLYIESLKQHGTNSKSVGWRDKNSQILRFKKLTTVIKDKNSEITVNDLGCGYGAMYNFLSIRFNIKRYIGYDISQEMLNKASELISINKNVLLIKDSKLKNIADYSFVSGIFNVKFDEKDEEWKNFIIETLDNMNEFSQKGFAFNLLTSYVDYKELHLYYGDPLFFFDYCKKNYSKKVSLIHDYNLWEWTITVEKD